MLVNKRMLSVSQDKLGAQAKRVFPLAQQVAGGGVFGVPTPNNYGTPLAVQWEQVPSPIALSTFSANITAYTMTMTTDAHVVRLENMGSGLCLAVDSGADSSTVGSGADSPGNSSTAPSSGVVVAKCGSKTASLDWMVGITATGGKCERGGDALQVRNTVDPSQCLGLTLVNGTSEYMRAGLVPCTGPTARWSYGRKPADSYLNMTFGVFEVSGLQVQLV
jgi:hypothetical protein